MKFLRTVPGLCALAPFRCAKTPTIKSVDRLVNAVNGETAVSYTYDAWGKLLSKSGTSSDYALIYQFNPLTYRGYIYDDETGFYYLQSRYYDPTIRRFINSDGQLNGGLLGYNLFAYCENNPVMRCDPRGNWCQQEFWELVYSILIELLSHSDEIINNIADDISSFDYDNEDELKVLNSHYFSCYKNHLVIRLPIGENAFSFGALFIGNGVSKTEIETVQHEYGHAVHMDQIGVINYTFFVAIPSLIGFFTVDYNKYFSLPWEYIADKLGGVQGRQYNNNPYPYLQNAETLACVWWLLSFLSKLNDENMGRFTI